MLRWVAWVCGVVVLVGLFFLGRWTGLSEAHNQSRDVCWEENWRELTEAEWLACHYPWVKEKPATRELVAHLRAEYEQYREAIVGDLLSQSLRARGTRELAYDLMVQAIHETFGTKDSAAQKALPVSLEQPDPMP